MTESSSIASFDGFASEYDLALQQGLSLVGEDKTYFARRRIEWLAQCLKWQRPSSIKVLDYGCGTGTSTRFFYELLQADAVTGVDISSRSLEQARLQCAEPESSFFTPAAYTPVADRDVAFCNGVFHHIPVNERSQCVRYIADCLRPGGLFAFWENNPWNPGTRWVMKRIPFDRDAILLSPLEARRLLMAAGFEVLSTHFLFIFPRFLWWLRWIEPLCARLPLGGQYQVLCRKPAKAWFAGNG